MADQDFAATVTEALDAAAQCAGAETSHCYAVLGVRLDELETLARKSLLSHVDYHPLVRKLKEGSALTPDDMATLRSLVVGDADYYIKYDDDFDRSRSELLKIVEQIRQLQSNEPDAATLMHVAVLCREATTLLAATEHYLEQKERVRRFEDATRGPLDREAARALARLIEGMAA